MVEVVLTNRAQKDLEDIFDYIAADNPQSALKIVEEIERKLEGLETLPESGRKVPELFKSPFIYREIIVRRYRVIYRYAEDKVYVLTVRHGKRSFP